jgi:fumarate reductase subunit D
MRLDYSIKLEDIEIPRFSVEAVEGIGKLFTLATLVLNVLDTKERIEIVFHGLNLEDPERKIAAFQVVVSSAATARELSFQPGAGGRIPSSSSYYQWLTIGLA